MGVPSDSQNSLYTWREPTEKLPWKSHFSSLLLSADPTNTALEIIFLLLLGLTSFLAPDAKFDTPGSMRLSQLASFLTACSLMRRLYNAYLEAVYFACPHRRTQPPSDHALKSKRDLNGRTAEQLRTLQIHDRLTLITQNALVIVLYYLVPGFYPSDLSPRNNASLPIRLFRLLAHHYLLSFGMYWMHRSLHVVPYLWTNIHSIHHWAKHPLSRNTYQDHWADNFGNALVGEVAAQILIPLDSNLFWFSRLFRIMESLEKHSGVSGWMNVAHSMQCWLPYAQMPHHHDWHHEGHKGCNFTFAALGGLWDCIFGTRKSGRAMRYPECATSQDIAEHENKNQKVNWIGKIQNPILVLLPVVAVFAIAACNLHHNQYVVM